MPNRKMSWRFRMLVPPGTFNTWMPGYSYKSLSWEKIQLTKQLSLNIPSNALLSYFEKLSELLLSWQVLIYSYSRHTFSFPPWRQQKYFYFPSSHFNLIRIDVIGCVLCAKTCVWTYLSRAKKTPSCASFSERKISYGATLAHLLVTVSSLVQIRSRGLKYLRLKKERSETHAPMRPTPLTKHLQMWST